MKHFLHGRPQVPGGALSPKGAHGGVFPATASEADGDSPNVEVVKQGDKIVRITVTCTCGERIELECIYPPGAAV